MGDTGTGGARPEPPRPPRWVVVVLAVACLVSAVGCCVLLWQQRGAADAETARQQALEAARQTAMNIATIDHEQARQDVDRVLAGATGDFRDQFAETADSLVAVVEQTQVSAVGERADAAVESWDGDHGTVLVEVSSTVTNLSVAQPQPRMLRMRMTIDRVGDGFKTSALEYVA